MSDAPDTGETTQQKMRLEGALESTEEAANAAATAFTDHGLTSDPFHAIVMPLRLATSYVAAALRNVSNLRQEALLEAADATIKRHTMVKSMPEWHPRCERCQADWPCDAVMLISLIWAAPPTN
jgi:hypothetical protein